MDKEEKIRFWIGQVTLIQFFYAVCVGVVLIFCEKILAKYLSNMPSVMLGVIAFLLSVAVFEMVYRSFLLKLVDIVVFSQLSRFILKFAAYVFFCLVIFRAEWYGEMESNFYFYAYYVASLIIFLWAAEYSENKLK